MIILNISDRFKDNLFKNLLDNEQYNVPLPKLIENIKFNLNHKENHNIKIKSDRSKVGFCYDQNKWKAINKNELLDELCNYSLQIFGKYFNEKKIHYLKIWLVSTMNLNNWSN